MKNANLVSGFRRWLVLCLLAAAGCDGGAPARPPPKGAAEFFPVKIGARTVDFQLAVTDAEMSRGLMNRKDLGPDQGMLFVYERPQQMSFWMRNTPTPLHIGFFTSDGVLREVYPLYPFDERAVASRREDLQYALEMRQGWFEKSGVKPGDVLDLEAVAAALKARGFEPRRFGLR